MASNRELPRLDPAHLAPYVSVLIARYDGTDPSRAVPLLKKQLLQRASRAQGAGDRAVLADGLTGRNVLVDTVDEIASEPDEIDAFSYIHQRPASWWIGPYSDDAPVILETELVTLVRRGHYVAISGSEFRSAIKRWIRGKDRPPFSLPPEWVLEQAILSGETKGLHLEGVHHRSALKPDTKTSTGIDLRETLSQQDNTYRMRSGRATLPDNQERQAFTGVAGTTPRTSVVWNRQAMSLDDFTRACVEVLDLIVETKSAGRQDAVFSQLASPVTGLDGVCGAYEVIAPTPDALSLEPGTPEYAQAELLSSSIIYVEGHQQRAHCTVGLGFEGVEAGKARIIVKVVDEDQVELNLHTEGSPGDTNTFAEIRDGLDQHGALAIYYESGHVIQGERVYLPNVDALPFRNWTFETFDPFNVAAEKPAKTEPEIHRIAGTAEDGSLFGWVVRHYRSGTLICDDGPGEIADFIHVDDDLTLRLIHVKAAHSASHTRGISAGAYEVVANQAVKNLIYLDQGRLLSHLESTLKSSRASWMNGARCDDRKPFYDQAKRRGPRDRAEIVIVQPHVRKHSYLKALSSDPRTPDALRLKLLDGILNSAAATAASAGAYLTVIGAT